VRCASYKAKMLASIENMLLTILGNIDNNNMAHIAMIYKKYI
jgi:hypothetical protein